MLYCKLERLTTSRSGDRFPVSELYTDLSPRASSVNGQQSAFWRKNDWADKIDDMIAWKPILHRQIWPECSILHDILGSKVLASGYKSLGRERNRIAVRPLQTGGQSLRFFKGTQQTRRAQVHAQETTPNAAFLTARLPTVVTCSSADGCRCHVLLQHAPAKYPCLLCLGRVTRGWNKRHCLLNVYYIRWSQPLCNYDRMLC